MQGSYQQSIARMLGLVFSLRLIRRIQIATLERLCIESLAEDYKIGTWPYDDQTAMITTEANMGHVGLLLKL
jgi:hypothetical protein